MGHDPQMGHIPCPGLDPRIHHGSSDGPIVCLSLAIALCMVNTRVVLLVPHSDPVSEGQNRVFWGLKWGPPGTPFGTASGPSQTRYSHLPPWCADGYKYLPFARIRDTGTYPSYDPFEVHFGPSQGTWFGTPQIHGSGVCPVSLFIPCYCPLSGQYLGTLS